MTATSSTVASHEGSQAALSQTGAESTASTGWLGGFGLFLAGLLGRRKKRDDKKTK
ncbi:LPXTG cell wall anchor domain-containing protein [Limosilactobacillus ingluviei]|uniref:LPXTG cell wall anchor domain-containing protein n=1 Tax=Limosilactobacillus ingluviei TaxID=148604 RepID=UPI00177AFBBD|nr:LPXTG cell wall anchor domain-containing protein [Limosilactobacillus ingluviei]